MERAICHFEISFNYRNGTGCCSWTASRQFINHQKITVQMKLSSKKVFSGTNQMPSCGDIEVAVLGGFLLDSSTTSKVLKMDESLFWDNRNKVVFRSIKRLVKARRAVDILTVTQDLRRADELGLLETEMGGGVVYVAELPNRVGSTANIDEHIMLMREKGILRGVIEEGTVAVKEAYMQEKDALEVLMGLQKRLVSLSAMSGLIRWKGGAGLVRGYLKRIDNIRDGGWETQGCEVGLRVLRKVINVWGRRKYFVLAGRPSMGKTSFVVSQPIKDVVLQKKKVLVFSLDMDKDSFMEMLIASWSGVNTDDLLAAGDRELEHYIGEIGYHTEPLINNEGEDLLYVDDTPAIHADELRGKVLAMKSENPDLEMVVVDYMQLVRGDGQTREERVGYVSKMLRALSKEADVCVVALAQLSRSVEQRGGDRRPTLADLRESGQIEQDSDMVVFFYRAYYYAVRGNIKATAAYDLPDREITIRAIDAENIMELIIAKIRGGRAQRVTCSWMGNKTKVCNYEEIC